MSIKVNGRWIGWPKPVVPEQVLRTYTDAPEETHDVWQAEPLTGRVHLVRGEANLRDGNEFRSIPKGAS